MLAILTTHPIQYQVPIWKALAARGRIPFKVLYMSDQSLRARFDPGFGRSLAWDIDLLGGYDHEFLDVHEGSRQDSFWWLRLKPGFGRTLRQMGARVLWVQGWQVAAYWQAVLQARRASAEVWLRGETNVKSNAGGFRQDLKRFVLRRLLDRVDRFLYVGEANRQFYLRQGIAKAKLAPAPYCVDNRRFAAQAESLRSQRGLIRERWGIPQDVFCFLFIGKFQPKKHPFDLVEAVRLLQAAAREKVHILWAGAGELGETLRKACEVHFDAEGMAPVAYRRGNDKPAASFAGFLNQSEISRAYVAADCLVLPSDAQETWGLVVNEAMASALPCIVSDACGCADDLVRPIRPDLCYRMGDRQALAHALARVMQDSPPPGLLQRHIDKYDYTRTVETVEALYQASIGQRNIAEQAIADAL